MVLATKRQGGRVTGYGLLTLTRTASRAKVTPGTASTPSGDI